MKRIFPIVALMVLSAAVFAQPNEVVIDRVIFDKFFPPAGWSTYTAGDAGSSWYPEYFDAYDVYEARCDSKHGLNVNEQLFTSEYNLETYDYVTLELLMGFYPGFDDTKPFPSDSSARLRFFWWDNDSETWELLKIYAEGFSGYDYIPVPKEAFKNYVCFCFMYTASPWTSNSNVSIGSVTLYGIPSPRNGVQDWSLYE
ncbi:MAG: hypothetical protein ABFD89_22610 [Bryobacteraceae bacterium]